MINNSPPPPNGGKNMQNYFSSACNNSFLWGVQPHSQQPRVARGDTAAGTSYVGISDQTFLSTKPLSAAAGVALYGGS